MTDEENEETEEWAKAMVDRLDAYDTKLDRITMALAKMIVGMSGQPVVIDIEKDLGVVLPRESNLVVPSSVVPRPRNH